MPGLWIMLPLALLLALVFLAFFFWSVRNGDYEDTEMEKYRILLDNDQDIDLSIQPKKKH
ncbi:MAG: cbb3-type cytochrome oxidase assembly protein CcoS [Candidatus Hydrogenedentota bacterium]|nr:MAG: cbb3-type cytochrome oxidase assembly protein CcoS [Candidatus Hydrogenedentota bacterium]